jgi:hypothetical protein
MTKLLIRLSLLNRDLCREATIGPYRFRNELDTESFEIGSYDARPDKLDLKIV